MRLRLPACLLASLILLPSDVSLRFEALDPGPSGAWADRDEDWIDEDDDRDDEGDLDDDGEDEDDYRRGRQIRPSQSGTRSDGSHPPGGAEVRDGSALTRGPYLQVATSTGITIRWRTTTPSGSRVRYGSSPDLLELTKDEPGETTEHEVRLADLRLDTRYYYSVGTPSSVLADGPDCSFRTAPPVGSERDVRVWIIGDSGLRGGAQQRVLQAYESYSHGTPTDVWLLVGDNAYDAGTSPQYQAGFFDPYRARLRSTVVWPSRGNHDVIRKGPGNDYYDFFTLPTVGEAGGTPSRTEAYFSFDYANIHFVCLDAERLKGGASAAMIEWLRDDMAATSQDWRIAYWHHPPYSKGSHDSDSDDLMIQARKRLVPVLEEGGVDLVVTGHSHSYERSFLLDGHYGGSSTLESSMILDRGDGRPDGGGAYRKPMSGRRAPREGAVYVVVGSSSKLSGGKLDHRAHAKSLSALGSLVLDISGQRLDATFLTDQGRAADRFTVVKGEGPSTFRGGRAARSQPRSAATPARSRLRPAAARHARSAGARIEEGVEP